jgi:hypothetical protein
MTSLERCGLIFNKTKRTNTKAKLKLIKSMKRRLRSGLKSFIKRMCNGSRQCNQSLKERGRKSERRRKESLSS